MVRRLVLLAAAASFGCRSEDTTPTVPSASGTPLTLDCTASNRDCPALVIAGDEPATFPDGRPSTVRGHADPSLRADPATGVLWLGYSWVHPMMDGARFLGVGVDTRLARSGDGGNSWRLLGTLWRADAEARDPLGRSGHHNTETLSLAPRALTGGSVWYSARFTYFTPDAGTPQISSFTTRVAVAASPEQLAAAPEAVLGGDLTHAHWAPDLNLASLTSDRPSESLRGCTFLDAGLLYHDGRLYLAAQCMLFRGGAEDTANEFVALFSTTPDGAPRQWRWRYLGRLASRADAVALGGENLLQTDLALARDGTVLAIFSPSAPVAEGAVLAEHFGCRAVAVASLDPPRLARDAAGAPVVRAQTTASDLKSPDGTPSACGYDASSATGLVMGRREDRNGLRSTLHRTGLRP